MILLKLVVEYIHIKKCERVTLTLTLESNGMHVMEKEDGMEQPLCLNVTHADSMLSWHLHNSSPHQNKLNNQPFKIEQKMNLSRDKISLIEIN